MLEKILGKRKTKITARVVFGAAASEHGEHGTIYADNKQKATTNDSVSFAFVGVTEIPALDDAVLAHIWEQAREAGYMPRSLRSYATVMTVKPAPIMRFDTPRPDPQVYRDQARAASKEMSKQHTDARQAHARRLASDPLNGDQHIGTSHHTPRVVNSPSH
jgi:hypothetical protein